MLLNDCKPRHSTRPSGRAARRHFLLWMLAAVVLPSNAASARATGYIPAQATSLAREAAFNAFYGLYVGGHKVGFMHATLRAEPTVELAYTLEATLSAMGQQSRVTMQERRTFAPTSGQLIGLSFAQTSATGTVAVRGRRRGGNLSVEVTAGGAQQRHSVEVNETLADNLAAWRLARSLKARPPGKVGDEAHAEHFDPASQTVTAARHAVVRIEQRLLGGVASQVAHIDTQYPALSVREAGVFDEAGQLLSTRIGGFFEARLEDESLAKRADVAGDLLLDAVVKVPAPLPGLADAARLQVALSGVSIALPSDTERQRVQVVEADRRVVVHLQRDAPVAPSLQLSALCRGPVARGARGQAKKPGKERAQEPNEVAQARLPSPFIQSDAQQIVAAAKQAIGERVLVSEVVAALVADVRTRLKSEYVPAFSNALEALEGGRGDCTEHSVLFVAMARAVGLPARVAVGVAFWPPGNGFGWHAWSEVWLGDRWLSVDPTWGQDIADVSHIKFAGGSPSEQMKVVMLLGQLGIDSWHLP